MNPDHPIHILLIEDDPAVAASLRSGLEREGYAVTWADTGAAGPAHARDGRTSLILLDVRHLCEKLELDPSRPSLILTVPGIGYRLVDWPSTRRTHRRDL